MKTCIDQVIHSAIRHDYEDINILYLGYNGWFESIFSFPNIMCYMMKGTLAYKWNGTLPITYTILSEEQRFVPNRVNIDLVICNSRRSQIHSAAEIANTYHLPLVIIEHELPSIDSTKKLRQYVNSRLPKCTHVITHPIIQKEWYLDEHDKDMVIIPYGFKPIPNNMRTNNVLVVGDYNKEDYGLLNTMISCYPGTIGIGYNDNLTIPYTDLKDIIDAMSKSRICITAMPEGCPPLLALLAMAAGCVVITNQTQWTESIIINSVNGFIFENAGDIKPIVRMLLTDIQKLNQISFVAQQATNANYNYDMFSLQWNNLIQTLITKVYKR